MTLDQIILQSLSEDIGNGDYTTLATIPGEANGRAKLLAKEEGIICGIDLAVRIFHAVDPNLRLEIFKQDGDPVVPGEVVLRVAGSTASILKSERLVLNFMQRLSGIATATRRAVQKLEGLNTRILDTRKTTPLLRELEKYAVRIGGGSNHRMGLYDMILVKDNHVDFCGGIVPAIEAVHRYLQHTGRELKIEIEVRNFEELSRVLEHGRVDRIMLDNFTPEDLREAVSRVGGRFETEASGGITETTLREFAETGVGFISMGSLTHHIKSLDLSLKADTGQPH